MGRRILGGQQKKQNHSPSPPNPQEHQNSSEEEEQKHDGASRQPGQLPVILPIIVPLYTASIAIHQHLPPLSWPSISARPSPPSSTLAISVTAGHAIWDIRQELHDWRHDQLLALTCTALAIGYQHLPQDLLPPTSAPHLHSLLSASTPPAAIPNTQQYPLDRHKHANQPYLTCSPGLPTASLILGLVWLGYDPCRSKISFCCLAARFTHVLGVIWGFPQRGYATERLYPCMLYTVRKL